MAADKKNLEAKWSEYLEQQKRDNVKYMLLSAAGILTVLIIWQGVVMLGLVDSRLLPPPTTVLATLVDKFSNTVPDGNVLGTNILASLQVALSGFCVAIIIGVPLGLLMGWWTYAERFIRPIFELVRPVPPHRLDSPGSGVDGRWPEGKGPDHLFHGFRSLCDQLLHGNQAHQPGAHRCVQNLRSSQLADFLENWNSVLSSHGICGHPRGAGQLLVHSGSR